MFDGNRAHKVEDFIGEQFSVMFFTPKGWDTVPDVTPEDRCKLLLFLHQCSVASGSCKLGTMEKHYMQANSN